MNVPSKSSVGSGNGKSSKMKSEHKVVIYGDSHSRGLSTRLKDKLPDSFEVIGHTKPNCGIQPLLSIRKQDIINLSNKDDLYRRYE
jgi:hypothetical protein